MVPVVDAIERVARTSATVLLEGESGTGKEILARAIHARSARAAKPFVAMNCAVLSENLIESELFGHEKGAFTGAHTQRRGRIELADGGTFLLDEVAEILPSLQAKLLRVLDDKQIRRVGGNKSRSVDVRVLAAANEDLEQRVREGTFREDLFYRISGVTFRLPPLRDRGDDLHRIAAALLSRLATEHGLPVPVLSREVKELLSRHGWPGNVRELKNAVERALLMSPPGERRTVPRTRSRSRRRSRRSTPPLRARRSVGAAGIVRNRHGDSASRRASCVVSWRAVTWTTRTNSRASDRRGRALFRPTMVKMTLLRRMPSMRRSRIKALRSQEIAHGMGAEWFVP